MHFVYHSLLLATFSGSLLLEIANFRSSMDSSHAVLSEYTQRGLKLCHMCPLALYWETCEMVSLYARDSSHPL